MNYMRKKKQKVVWPYEEQMKDDKLLKMTMKLKPGENKSQCWICTPYERCKFFNLAKRNLSTRVRHQPSCGFTGMRCPEIEVIMR
jgi:hypothetical protein